MTPTPTPVRVLLAVPLVLVATALVALCWPASPAPGPPSGPDRDAATAAAVVDPAVEVLHAWDRRRAAAWRAGDPTALAGLYAPGARAGRVDVALLREYVRRGLAVDRLEPQLLAVEVVERFGSRVVLVVTDRLARVVARHGGRVVELPEDRPSTTRIAFVRRAGAWVVREAQPAR